MEETFEEPRSRVVLVDGEVFKPYEYQREEELESKVTGLVKFVFGPEALYFDLRQRVASRAEKINVTDGVLLELKKEGDGPRLWLVEYELSSHDLYRHVQPQILGFIRSLRNPQTLREVQLALYEEIRADERKEKAFREFLGPDKDAFYFLDRTLHKKCGVIIVIDEVSPQLAEICEDFARYAEARVIEFKTYQKGDREIYQLTPFATGEEARAPETERRKPEYMKSWEAQLRWVDPDTRTLVSELLKRLESELPGISHSPKGRWYYLYRGRAARRRSLFAVLLLAKSKVNIRLRVDPGAFQDGNQVTKRYRGWFFRTGGEERGFSIQSLEQLDEASALIRQAYDFAGG